jgi:YVTN family beta-propeller protein
VARVAARRRLPRVLAAQSEIGRLEERRLVALEERIEADLALGRHADLVGELEALIAQHPLRERLRGQLMLALYRSGRQAEALHAYQETRHTLVEELGIEPGQALQRLHTRMLQQDPSLELVVPPEEPERPPADRRRPQRTQARLLVVGGVLLLIAALTALGVSVFSGSDSASLASVAGNSVARIDTDANETVGQIAVGATPTTVAVGEGAIWALNADDQTISRIDPETRAVETFGTGSTPMDLAVGQGGVWVANGEKASASTGPAITSVSKLDPDHGDARATIDLPGAGHPVSNAVQELIAVGAGSVWAVNPDFSVSRIDPRSGAATRIGGLDALAIAAGERSVWTLNGDNTVVRIDPRTNRLSKPLKVPATGLTDLAVDGTSVWLTSPFDGVVWRIDQGPRTLMRTIPVEDGVDHVAIGDGSIWATNSLRGTISRIDPKTNRVIRTISLGNAPRNAAVGEGSVWVAVSGGAGGGLPAASPADEVRGMRALPGTICGRVFHGGGKPDLLIASDLPLQGGGAFPTLQMSEAIAYVLRQRRFRAGQYRVAYQSCDDSTSRSGNWEPEKCAANAKAYAANPDVVSVIGPYNSGCALELIPITNQARGGPLAVVSPYTSVDSLTRPAPRAPPDLMERLYPTGTRNYARTLPTDGSEAAANAQLAQKLGVRRVYVLHDGDDLFGRPRAIYFRNAARKLGMQVVGFRRWDPAATDYRPLATAVGRARAEGVFLGGGLYDDGGQVIAALRDRLGPRVAIFAPQFQPVSALFDEAGPAAAGTYVSLPGLTNDVLPAEGRRFAVSSARPSPADGSTSRPSTRRRRRSCCSTRSPARTGRGRL